MEVNNNLLQSAKISLAMQLVIGIVGIHGIFIALPEKDKILTDIMILETTVQFIEMMFYIWLVFYLSRLNFDVTYVRYFDWFFINANNVNFHNLFYEISRIKTVESNDDYQKHYENKLGGIIENRSI